MYEADMAVQPCKDPHKLLSDRVSRSRASKSKEQEELCLITSKWLRCYAWIASFLPLSPTVPQRSPNSPQEPPSTSISKSGKRRVQDGFRYTANVLCRPVHFTIPRQKAQTCWRT